MSRSPVHQAGNGDRRHPSLPASRLPHARLQSGQYDAEANRIITMLEYQAREKDREINQKLLMKLVENYAQLERELAEKQLQIEEDLRAAASIQRSLLPHHLPELDPFGFAAKFIPCNFLGGDMFNVFAVTENILGIYMLDVSGHGIPAAMVTVSVSQTIQETWSSTLPHSPKEVLESLEKDYPFERFEKFFTIVYLLLDTTTGQLNYCNAGHPPPLLLHADGRLETLETGGGIVGLSGMLPFAEEGKRMEPGDTLLLYTDGLPEYEDASGECYGQERLAALLPGLRRLEPGALVEEVHGAMMRFGHNRPVQDDVALLAIRCRET